MGVKGKEIMYKECMGPAAAYPFNFSCVAHLY